MGEIDKLDIERSAKLEGCCAYVKQLRAESEMISAEMIKVRDRLKAMLERNQKREQSFLDYMRMNLKEGEKFEKGVHAISWRKSESADPVNMSQIPETYLHMTWSPDRAKALRDMRAGQVVPGFQLVTKNNLVIK